MFSKSKMERKIGKIVIKLSTLKRSFGVICVVVVSIVLILYHLQEKAEVKTSRKQINFVDTSVDVSSSLTSRQSCAFESAAMMNPDSDVNIHFVSKERYHHIMESSQVILMLTSMYSNIRISYFDLLTSSIGSPAEEFMESGQLETSKYPMEHKSDMARLLILWKFPGTYLDSDVIVQKSLQDYPSNFIYQEHKGAYFNGAVMRIENRELVKSAMEYFVKHFLPGKFASNGPVVLTGTIKMLCNMTNMNDIMKKRSCHDFHFLSSEDCYEIYYHEWRKFFEPNSADEVMTRTKNSSIVHFWHYLSKSKKINKTSDVAYIRMAKMYCPLTLQNTLNLF